MKIAHFWSATAGLRSHAETLRALIRTFDPDELPAPQLTADQRQRAQAEFNRMMTPMPQTAREMAGGPDLGEPLRMPRAKPGSRLKKR